MIILSFLRILAIVLVFSACFSSLYNTYPGFFLLIRTNPITQYFIIHSLQNLAKISFAHWLNTDYKTMQAREVSGLNYQFQVHSSPPYPCPPHYSSIQNNISTFQLQRFANQLYNFQNPPQVQDFSPQSSCLSSNSTSDEADEQQQNLIISERKHRRMISNRESARRSRMRKQKHLDELWSQVVWLRNENHQLIDKLNHVSESHDRVVQENVQLKEEASELCQMLKDMRLNSPCPSLSPLQDVLCSSSYLGSDSSNQSLTTSTSSADAFCCLF